MDILGFILFIGGLWLFFEVIKLLIGDIIRNRLDE